MSSGPKKSDEIHLRESLETDPGDWDSRKQLAHLFYDQGKFQEAADLVWAVDELPSIDVELAFAALLEHNHGKAVQNLGLANALLHHGMVLQAARFYGAALEADPALGNPDLEHFILWTDDEETLWGNFNNRRPTLGELPWMKRDPMEAMKLTSRINTHTTPVKLPSLKPAANEELQNELYQQKAEKAADPSPPPAVTIPLDRVDPKYRLFDDELGAPTAAELPGLAAAVVTPTRQLAKPDFSAAGSMTKPLAPPLNTIPLPPLPPDPGPRSRRRKNPARRAKPTASYADFGDSTACPGFRTLWAGVPK